jgi:uroporphyrinogen-III synthase
VRRLVVVRPEPGNARTAAAARAKGWTVDAMPLFAVVSVAWVPPDPAIFDALLLTSANAVRHAGETLASLRALPVVAVGQATATAARDAGLAVVLTGDSDAAAGVVEARARGFARLLHLAGRDRVEQPGVTAMTVYASEALPPPAGAAARLDGAVVLLHSARAARTVAALAGTRATTAVAALSPAVLDAAGTGWRAAAAAARPTDAALLAAAATLAD